jgi:hypothetical protein
VTVHVYCTTGYLTASIIRARLVAEVEVESPPDNPEDFADQYGGDLIEVATGEEDYE